MSMPVIGLEAVRERVVFVACQFGDSNKARQTHEQLALALDAYAEAIRAKERERWQKATAFCAAHQPNGGARARCLVCGLMELTRALSRIDYTFGPPNEMGVSHYDVEPDEDAVVERARTRDAEVAALVEAGWAAMRAITLQEGYDAAEDALKAALAPFLTEEV